MKQHPQHKPQSNNAPLPLKPRSLRKVRIGKVISNKAHKTITVLIDRRVKHPLYGKYIRKTTKLVAHDQDNICQIDDQVKLMETRPLSKSKCWRLVEVIKKAI